MKQLTQHQILVREYIETDLATVKEVFESAFSPLRSIYKPSEAAAAHQEERFQEGTRLVAEIESRIVGTVQFSIHKKHVHLIGLAVLPDYQRQGVARHFIHEVIARMPILGHKVVALDTIKETGNVPVFEKLGFQVIREQVAEWCVSDNYPQVHEVIMERKIS